jgi:hypothetical protein
LMEDYKEIARGTKRVGELEVAWIDFTSLENGMRVRSLNHITVVGEHVVTMAGVCLDSQYVSLSQQFIACAESLKLTDVETK